MHLRICALLAIVIVGLVGAQASPEAKTVLATNNEGVAVTYGSVLKLMHDTTNGRLHASDIRYNAGGPQYFVVTGHRGVVNSDSYWVVKPVEGSSLEQGDLIPNGSVVRLQHMRTNNWLHSRSFPSPLSRNLEVSSREGQDEDTGDLWRLELVDESEVWMKDRKIRLKHVVTGSFLHSHEMTYVRVLPRQMEVCSVGEESVDNVWLASEGVYLQAGSAATPESVEK
ncbi:hypothetical protein GOP47_0020139 [Adiantum capillus-veneris]|uniref:MIR domain-containing protein n=1 Tax=Adiantum capillus-veneris TaxID=13818 RepID=A0A9D4UDS6_ADICA|nr:hypothetical protein GOP47_0020139 [Adiantum capillus-veneris]